MHRYSEMTVIGGSDEAVANFGEKTTVQMAGMHSSAEWRKLEAINSFRASWSSLATVLFTIALWDAGVQPSYCDRRTVTGIRPLSIRFCHRLAPCRHFVFLSASGSLVVFGFPVVVENEIYDNRKEYDDKRCTKTRSKKGISNNDRTRA